MQSLTVEEQVTILRILAEPDIQGWLANKPPEQILDRWLQTEWSDWWAVYKDDTVVGIAGVRPYGENPLLLESVTMLGEEGRGQGLYRTIKLQQLQAAADLGAEQLVVTVNETNDRSLAAAEHTFSPWPAVRTWEPGRPRWAYVRVLPINQAIVYLQSKTK